MQKAGIFLLVFLVWTFLPPGLQAQIRPMIQEGVTRAVVIGVSEYQNERIPRLQYAHADADAFAKFLLSPSGGSLPESQVKLLTNKQATQGQMAAALTWLLEESKEGDAAIIYFSGHGDMETQTVMNYGFLLTYDAPASTYMAGGAFPVIYLQSIVQTLSTQKNVQVILITDACHAGKLAGSAGGGPQATAKVLADQFANEAKLLSCQPDEFSIEGPQWGGGHGVFTYYLIDGLMGLADTNGDGTVTLLEIQRFLEDNVSASADPHPQIPLVFGNKGMKLAKVDAPALAALKAARADSRPDALSGAVASRSAAQSIDPDTLTMAMYGRFNASLKNKHLLYPEEDAAYTLYMALRDRPLMAAYRQNMRRELAAALQDEAQSAILDYLAASPVELRRRWSFDARYDRYPEYLGKAAEILGSEHFMNKELSAKALYFRGLNLRLKGERERDAAMYKQAVELQNQALALDPAAAYAYNELGLLARRTRDFEASVGFFKQALALSPTWVLAETNLCGSYADLKQYGLAEEACNRALQYDSTFALAHHNLGFALGEQQKWDAAIAALQKAVDYDPGYILSHMTLADAYYVKGERRKAMASWKEAIRIEPDRTVALYNLGVVSTELGEAGEALPYFHAIIAIDSTDVDAWLEIAELQMEAGRHTEAEVALQTARGLAPENPGVYYLKAKQHLIRKQTDAALDALQIALEKGFNDAELIQEDSHFDAVRKHKRFKSLMDAYFPK